MAKVMLPFKGKKHDVPCIFPRFVSTFSLTIIIVIFFSGKNTTKLFNSLAQMCFSLRTSKKKCDRKLCSPFFIIFHRSLFWTVCHGLFIFFLRQRIRKCKRSAEFSYKLYVNFIEEEVCIDLTAGMRVGWLTGCASCINFNDINVVIKYSKCKFITFSLKHRSRALFIYDRRLRQKMLRENKHTAKRKKKQKIKHGRAHTIAVYRPLFSLQLIAITVAVVSVVFVPVF